MQTSYSQLHANLHSRSLAPPRSLAPTLTLAASLRTCRSLVRWERRRSLTRMTSCYWRASSSRPPESQSKPRSCSLESRRTGKHLSSLTPPPPPLYSTSTHHHHKHHQHHNHHTHHPHQHHNHNTPTNTITTTTSTPNPLFHVTTIASPINFFTHTLGSWCVLLR